MSKYKPTTTVAERREARAVKVSHLHELMERPAASDPSIIRLATERFGAGFSPRNQILIIMQRPDATRVAGFRTWIELGRKVRKGAKGIAILVPFTPKRDEQPGEMSPKPRMMFGTGYVFDIGDTEPV